uniref:Beta-glucosidase (EC) n=1 Tax=Ganoderma boninense TaxID=34458 RepID=A0A5K1K4P8_9APHY|nr:Beta-glucosidase (EC [Ganoderma boninense]
MPLGRIYTGTLLSTLNSRTTLREELYSGASMVGERLAERMRRIPKEIGVAVEQDVQMDPLGGVDLKHAHHDDASHGVGLDSEADYSSQTQTRDRKVPAGDLEFQAV